MTSGELFNLPEYRSFLICEVGNLLYKVVVSIKGVPEILSTVLDVGWLVSLCRESASENLPE